MASAVISGRKALAPPKRPQGFVPPTVRAAIPARLSHLDPRPLWVEDAPVKSPWKSATFWAACTLVVPVGTVLKATRRFFG